MTADETGPGTQRAGRRATSTAKAYDRRSRREQAVATGRLTRTGSPIAAAMSRVPFVATIILLLAAGIVGVLWLNTVSDATALKATTSRIRQATIKTDIEALQKDVNTLQDPARLAAEANRLGLVPAGDSALLNIGADGKGTVIGTPTPVPGHPVAPPTPVAPATSAVPATSAAPVTSAPPASTTSSATASVTTTPATTSPATTTRVTTAPATTGPATTAPASTAPLTTKSPVTKSPVTQSTVTTSTVTKSTVTKSTVTTAPVPPKPAKSTAATAPGQRTTTTSTGAGR